LIQEDIEMARPPNGFDCENHCEALRQLQIHRDLANRLDAIIDSSFDGLWICDGQGRVIRLNKASERMNSIKAEQVLGRKMEALIEEGLIDRSVTLEVLKNHTAVTDIQYLKNGKQLLVTGNPVFDSHGNIHLVVVNERDITSLTHLWHELHETRALASKYRSVLSLKQAHQVLFKRAVARSDVMCKVLEAALKVAQTDTTVLIQGESGVGKGFLGKLIHCSSQRKDGPFIRVDCVAVPDSLMESELFGYERGAFTGARPEGKPGHFELAEGGTLFLDEIGDMPLSVQAKLLRFLEDNTIIRVGGTRSKRINTRIIAATHYDLKNMVKRGTFRGDLFFRLSVVPVHIPPLRERREDIPAHIHFLLREFNQKYSTNKYILPGAIDCLCRYSFPGNIRELSNLIEQLVVLTQAENIGDGDLPSYCKNESDQGDVGFSSADWDLPMAVKQVEKQLIRRALQQFQTQRKAAKLLGVNQSTLARKAKRYGIRSDAILHQYD
jgi:PAS domain S-box-containing protein